MLCPVDDSQLKVGSSRGHQIYHCRQCLGGLLNGNALREVRAYAALELHKQQGEATSVRPCPTDGKAMRSLEYKGVAMRVCPQCFGLWLDAAQLSRLLELASPPTQANLSKIGQSLTTMPRSSAPGRLEELGHIVEFSAGIFKAIGKFVD